MDKIKMKLIFFGLICGVMLCFNGLAGLSAGPVKAISIGEPLAARGNSKISGAGFSYTVKKLRLSGAPKSSSEILWRWNQLPGAVSYQLFSSTGAEISGSLASNASNYLQAGFSPKTSYSAYVVAHTPSGRYKSAVAKAVTLGSKTFAISAVSASGPNSDFKLGEVYVFPNPARAGAKPVFHIEVGIADSVKIKVYNVAGEPAHQQTLAGEPQIVSDGNGLSYAYEYVWDGHIPSGVYYYLIEAEKAGRKLKAKGKLAVVR
jgi:hypothetical protein